MEQLAKPKTCDDAACARSIAEPAANLAAESQDAALSALASTAGSIQGSADAANSPDNARPAGRMFDTKPPLVNLVVAAALLVAALVCAIPLANVMSDPQTYTRTVAALDAKQDVATDFMLATAGASIAITVAGTGTGIGKSIADKLADISGNVAIVLAAILLEKYFLTVIGLAAFRLIIPLGLALLALGLLLCNRPDVHARLRIIGAKLVLFAAAISVCIPLSMFVSGMVQDAYDAATGNKMQNAITALQSFGTSDEGASEQGILESVGTFLGKAASAITGLPQALQAVISGVVEVSAMLIVLNCLVPILTILACLWITNLLLGTNIPIPKKLPKFGSKMRREFAGEIGKQ